MRAAALRAVPSLVSGPQSTQCCGLLTALSCSSPTSHSYSSLPDRHTESVFDVAVIGSGMVGAAVAAALGSSPATSHLRVALIDREVPQNVFSSDSALPDVPGLRVSTLTPASTKFLQDVGAWRWLHPPVSAPFLDMQVWDDRGPGYVRYTASEAGKPEMGHVVENSAIQSALLRCLEQQQHRGNLERFMPAAVDAIVLPPYGSRSALDISPSRESPTSIDAGGLAEVELQDGRKLRCRLVVGADGAASRTRKMADLRTVGWQYGQRGVVATVRTDELNNTAWQSFLGTGPLALLPVRDGYSNIVWSTTPSMARELEEMDPHGFAAAVNSALAAGGPSAPAGPKRSDIASRLTAMATGVVRNLGGQGQPPFLSPPQVLEYVGSRPRSFPLQLVHSGRYVRSRLALVGDAAHAVHPLAGQGVNLGFGDAEALAKAIRYALQVGADVGDMALLQSQYEAPRQQANLGMMAALDGLKRVFGAQAEPLAALRNFGLQLINSTPAARFQVLKYAMDSGR